MVLGDLVTKLANRGHFDGAGPIWVHETQLERQVLQILLTHIFRLIQRHKVMSWRDAALGCQLRHQEEIEALVFLSVLNKLGINDGSRLWIGCIRALSDKHSLINPLVNHDEWYLGHGHWVAKDLGEDGSELLDLSIDDLLSLLLTDTVSEDNDLFRIVAVFILELIKCTFVDSIEVFRDNFLTFCLANDILVKTCTGWVSRGNKANYWILACVADIHSNDHDLWWRHETWELNADWLAAYLAVYLLHDVWSHTHVHLLASLPTNTLTQNIELCKHAFDVLVIWFTIYNHYEKQICHLVSTLLTIPSSILLDKKLHFISESV